MRVVSCMIVLASLCMTVTGCSLFKKNTDGTSGTSTAGGKPPAKFPGAQDPLLNSNPSQPPPAFPATPAAQSSSAKGNEILAGTVIDAYQRPVGNAYIRWVNLDEKDVGAPIDVATDTGGHFIIQGLKPGGSYKLIARTKQGEKMLAGTVLTSAPNVRVLIPIREDLVNASTPPLPGAPAFQGNTPKKDDNAAWNTNPGKPAADPPNLPATLTVPAATNLPVANPPPSPSTSLPSFVPGIVENADPNRLPMLTIPNKNPPPLPPVYVPPDPPRPPVAPPGNGKLDTGPTRVPSCVLVGGTRLENLALKDSKGQDWEYKKQAAGKLLLIDFWGTYCVYCRDSMPALNKLNAQYASRGVEVIGIALEGGKDERREAEAVNKMCASMQVSYRQLLGHTGSFDVGKNFGVKALPTLILLSEQGQILWRHEGRPDAATLGSLERVIQNRLNNRSF